MLIDFPNASRAITARAALREQLAGAVEQLVAIIDLLDGDADDGNANGDELDGSNAEDDWWPHALALAGPGCPIADPDKAVDDEGEPDNQRSGAFSDVPPEYGEDQTRGPLNVWSVPA